MKTTLATGRPLLLLLLLLLGLAGCDRPQPAGHAHGGHSHGGHGHDDHGGHGHGGEDEGDTASFTLFTDTHELFVELDVPVAGETVGHHAHVTRLADNAPAEGGSFGVAFLAADDPNRVAQSHAVKGVARTGIFTPSGKAPQRPGRYRLAYRYQDGDEVAEWDAGEIEVGREAVIPEPPREGEITFLKETSWFMPFRVRQPERRALARSLTLPAHVEADPRLSSSLAAPATGRVLWSSGEQATLPGRRVAAGEIMGRLVPESSYESWNALELELGRARIDRDRAEAQRQRLEGLLADGLVSERRVLDARAEADRASAALRSARRELEARSGSAPAIELRAPADGVVTELLLPHGERAEAGRALARIAAIDRVLVHGTLRGARPDELNRLSHARARTVTGRQEIDLLGAGATLLSTPLVVDPRSGGLEVSWSVPNDGRLLIGELVELTVGLGEPVERLTIPVSAVVEVNTRPQAFVQVTGESFEQRRLELGVSDGERVEVLSGLSEDDLVVTQGGFEVYVASIAGSVESHRH